jgi:hypothetical protein
MLQTWMFSSGLKKYSAGDRGDYVFFKGVILLDIPDTARFSGIDSIGNRITAVCAGYAMQCTGVWH